MFEQLDAIALCPSIGAADVVAACELVDAVGGNTDADEAVERDEEPEVVVDRPVDTLLSDDGNEVDDVGIDDMELVLDRETDDIESAFDEVKDVDDFWGVDILSDTERLGDDVDEFKAVDV